ncbi:hypothetical protein BC827DRAFT_1387315 [Russula dissimulans]|nr:hypothetical protein BC827DRAFT_1387315 [Russula dissimulans]
MEVPTAIRETTEARISRIARPVYNVSSSARAGKRPSEAHTGRVRTLDQGTASARDHMSDRKTTWASTIYPDSPRIMPFNFLRRPWGWMPAFKTNPFLWLRLFLANGGADGINGAVMIDRQWVGERGNLSSCKIVVCVNQPLPGVDRQGERGEEQA